MTSRGTCDPDRGIEKMTSDPDSSRRLRNLERGSPEWTALVNELLRRDRLDDVDELCRLMGIETPQADEARK
jgi:hypothetical protein